ncbi:MAG: hypothetical protein IPJ03_16550 [Ignavibacteriales bacterium]|nr:hypothetical protein [Ignavibacteriales bacterium]
MAKFQVKVKGLDKLKRDLKSIVENVVTRDDMEIILVKARDIIYRRSKSGKGITSEKNGSEIKFPSLNEKYVQLRKNKILGPFGRPNLSNITLSGELLESVTYRVISNKQGIVYVPNDNRADGDLTNKQLAEILATKKDRLFMGLTTKDERILDAFINRLVRDKLRRQRKL